MTLSGGRLQQIAWDTAVSLPDVSHGHLFDPHLDVWKAGEEVFLLVTADSPDLQIITIKADPFHGDALRRDHESITAGHHLDKKHWISIGRGPGVTSKLIENLVHTSDDPADAHHPEPS